MAKTAANGRVTLPVVEERAVVRKRKKVTGAVRVRTEVREDVEVVDQPLAVSGSRSSASRSTAGSTPRPRCARRAT